MLFTKFIAAVAAGICLSPLGTSGLTISRLGELVMSNESPALTKANWDWVDCGSPEDVVQLKSIDVAPELKPGTEMTLTVVADVIQRIEEGAYADVTVKLGLVKLLQKRFDMCEEARNAKATVQCPIEPGSYNIPQKFTLPKEIPPAKFTVSVRGYTADDEPMLCADIKADFMPKSPRFSVS